MPSTGTFAHPASPRAFIPAADLPPPIFFLQIMHLKPAARSVLAPWASTLLPAGASSHCQYGQPLCLDCSSIPLFLYVRAVDQLGNRETFYHTDGTAEGLSSRGQALRKHPPVMGLPGPFVVTQKFPDLHEPSSGSDHWVYLSEPRAEDKSTRPLDTGLMRQRATQRPVAASSRQDEEGVD